VLQCVAVCCSVLQCVAEICALRVYEIFWSNYCLCLEISLMRVNVYTYI